MDLALIDGWAAEHAQQLRRNVLRLPRSQPGCLLLIGVRGRAREGRLAFGICAAAWCSLPPFLVSSAGDRCDARGLVSLALGVAVLGSHDARAGSTAPGALCVAVAVRAEAPLSSLADHAVAMALLIAAWSRSTTLEPLSAAHFLAAAVLICATAGVVLIAPAAPLGSAALMALIALVTAALAVGAPSGRAVVIVFAPLWIFGAASLVQQWRHDPAVLPFAAALTSMSQARPQARELLVGTGITRGAAWSAARRSGWRVVDLPTEPWVGELNVAGRRPSAGERAELERRLAHRVIDTYGTATNEQGSVGWAVHRPMAISLLPAIERSTL
ncbi:MAG: hypothetical protein U0V87_16065 [Acidobacteriota bacterium]